MKSNHIGCLDGLRGLAALWVIVGHAALLTGRYIPVASHPDFAVDLFMILSGFLMTHHAIERESREPWDEVRTAALFWLRRFFRIAPVYYVVLALALATSSLLAQWRDTIASVVPYAATDASRYLDVSLDNILAHVFFVFGLSPHYGFRTPLPDWSIGLEMQFYFVFPVLMFIWRRAGVMATTALALGSAALLWFVAGDFLRAFPMPTLIALKINLFLSGLLMAAAYHTPGWRVVLAGCALTLPLLPLEPRTSLADGTARAALAALVAALLLPDLLPSRALRNGARALGTAFGTRPFRFLAEMSYSAYLVHLLVMLPVAALLDVTLASRAVRLICCLAVVLPATYALSAALHALVEAPGIAMGRWLTARMGRRPLLGSA